MLAIFALALSASRAFGEANCISDIRQANGGPFCHGSTKPDFDGTQPPAASPAAINPLTGAVGAGLGSVLGNALVAPLTNQYHHKTVKSVVKDDEDVFNSHPIGITAADDIIGNYTAQEDSYAGKLNHFRQLHDAEMEKRRDALDLIRGTSAEKWCAAHINILFPTPPASNVVNRYANTVRAYDAEKQTWDKRCGGPSVMPGYESFTEGLAALKPDAPAEKPGAVAKTEPAKPPPDAADQPDETAKTPPAKASPPSSGDEDELLPTPPQAKSAGDVAESPAAPSPAAPNPAPDAPADAAPAQGAAGSSDANTNHSTEFFGIKNAKVTQADLQDQRAPDLAQGGSAATAGTTPSMLAQGKPLRVLPSGTPANSLTPSEYGIEGRGGYDYRYDTVWGKETVVDDFIAQWNFIEPLKALQARNAKYLYDKVEEKGIDKLKEKTVDAIANFVKRVNGSAAIVDRAIATQDGRSLYKKYVSGLSDDLMKNTLAASEGNPEPALKADAEEAKRLEELRHETVGLLMGEVGDPMEQAKDYTLEKTKENFPLTHTKNKRLREDTVCYVAEPLGIGCSKAKIIH